MSGQERYALLLRDHVSPGLRAAGFRGGAGRYRLPAVAGGYAQLGFQRSPWNEGGRCAFTINVSYYPKDVWSRWRHSMPDLPECPTPVGTYAFSYDEAEDEPGWWVQRLGHLMPYSHDHWWGLDDTTDLVAVGTQVVQALTSHALPALLAEGTMPTVQGDFYAVDCHSRFCPSGGTIQSN